MGEDELFRAKSFRDGFERGIPQKIDHPKNRVIA